MDSDTDLQCSSASSNVLEHRQQAAAAVHACTLLSGNLHVAAQNISYVMAGLHEKLL